MRVCTSTLPWAGDQLLYVHVGWQSWYERERIIQVLQGHVVKDRNVDHTQRFLDRVAQCPHLTNADGVIEGRGYNIPSLEWPTDEAAHCSSGASGN